MTNELFKQQMVVLQTCFGKKIEIDQLRVYWEILKKFEDNEFSKACSNLCETFKPTLQVPFPLPAHFIEIINGTPKDNARTAVQRLREAISRFGRNISLDFGDRALHNVIEAYGGWPAICDWSDDDWKFKETAFCEHYIASKRRDDGSSYVVGRFEIQNGYITKYSPIEFFPVNESCKRLVSPQGKFIENKVLNCLNQICGKVKSV